MLMVFNQELCKKSAKSLPLRPIGGSIYCYCEGEKSGSHKEKNDNGLNRLLPPSEDSQKLKHSE